MKDYDVAQVCPNGHVANGQMNRSPAFNREFCEQCGEKTLTTCPACNTSIRGDYLPKSGGGMVGFGPPAFCYNCGAAFPWTERKIQAAIDLFVDQVQDEAARREFTESVHAIARDTPQAQVAANRLKRLLTWLKDGTVDVVRKMLVDVAASGIKSAF